MNETKVIFLATGIFIAVYNIFLIRKLDEDLNFISKISIYFFMTSTILLSLVSFRFNDNINMNTLLFSVLLSVVTLFTKSSKGEVLFLSGIIPINIINFQNIIFSSYELITKNNISNINTSIQSLDKTRTVVLYIALVIITLKIVSNIIINNSEYIEKSLENEKSLGIKLILIFSYMVNMGFARYLYVLGNTSGFSMFVLFCSATNLLISWFIIKNSIAKGTAKKFKEKTDLLNEQIKNQYNHYVELEKYYSEIFRIKHDINNHNNIISVLLQNEEYNELKNYMDKYCSNIIDLERDILICKNKIIDAICLSKKVICEEKGIDINFDIKVPENINIDDLDLCAIYGNLLDNAIEACDRISDKYREKVIDIQSKVSNGYLTIKLTNSKADVSIRKDNKFITLKKDKKYHGIGIESVRRSINKYNGQLILKDKGEVFIACVIIKNK
ncbi:sensor histidine kinase [Clostridium sardiniense]|uniref:sensor histidine kinase n=1 Tax=Clostridium sardiniense TaxID=29369 RepID=UPI003D338CF9